MTSMNHTSKDNIKSTAITYKGYDYQTLFGVSVLADWLNFPDKYQKVLFEAISMNHTIYL